MFNMKQNQVPLVIKHCPMWTFWPWTWWILFTFDLDPRPLQLQNIFKAVNWYKRVALNCMVSEFVIYLVTMVMIKIHFLFHMYSNGQLLFSYNNVTKKRNACFYFYTHTVHAADYQLLYDLWLLCSFGRHWLTSSRSWYAKIKFPSDN